MVRVMDVAQMAPLVGDAADTKLAKLGLNRTSLLAAADAALAAARDVSPFALKMAPGMYMFLVGSESLRGELIGDRWQMHAAGNLEGVVDAEGSAIIYFQSAVSCCQPYLPQPRSKKGPQSEVAASVNLFEAQGVDLPQMVSSGDGGGAAVYYLLVDEDGRVELSSMVIKDGAFVACGERIFLRQDGDLASVVEIDEDQPDAVIEVAISRKW